MYADESNPLLAIKGLPRFDLVAPGHVVPAVRAVLASAHQKLDDIEQGLTPTWEGLLAPLEELERPFEYAWGPVNHLLGVKNSPALREAHETVLPEVVAFGLRLRQSEALYRGLKDIRQGPAWEDLDAPRRRVVELKLREAELAGVGLSADARERFNAIEHELSRLGTDFSNHVLDAIKAFSFTVTDVCDTEGWPEGLRRLASQSHNLARPEDTPPSTPEAGPWRITRDQPVFVPFLQHSRNRAQREQVYRSYITTASSGEFDNSGIIEQTLKLRREKARILGYASYAELSLASKMAPSVAAVEAMFGELREASLPAARRDFEELTAFAAASGHKEPLAQWDIAFWAERLRETRFDFTDEELRPYFPLPRVLEGLFGLAGRLFGITISEAQGQAPLWHTDVRFYTVRDARGEKLAAFYLDPYSRPHEKRGGAWMDECLGRRRVDGQLRHPVVYLCCNATPPVGDTPALMSFREVETLFHEFGHGLQGMLTTVDLPDVAGISGVEWDAVELPSQFMENWCYHEPTLTGMTAHVETGEQLPAELFAKIIAARTFRAGSLMMRQLEFGLTDMALHHIYDPQQDGNAFAVHHRIASQTGVLPVLPEDRFLCAFSHIFAGGYAAGYYSYKWAEVLSADAFAAFEEAGLDDERAVTALGERFRDTFLALGGSRHPLEVFAAFRGRAPKTEALLRHNGLLEGDRHT